jgi:hypothetical protein
MDNQSLTGRDFVESAELPEFTHRRQVAGMENVATGDFPSFDAPELAVAIGSQIASFSDALGADMKADISNGFLFAQQVADKRVADMENATSLDWYASYVDVLSRIGWNRENQSNTLQEISGRSGDLHKEIIPIVTAALGPAGAAAAVVTVLQGLQNMNKSSPWITLFSQSSQRATANQFQVSHAFLEDGVPRINLVAFELSAQRQITQVLFFKLSSNDASLRKFETKMSVDNTIFSGAAPILAQRLQERTKEFILSIPLL